MKIVVISSEGDDPGERAVVDGLFAVGLERYHIRKPRWAAERMEAWLGSFPADRRSRMIAHQHHELVPRLGLGGCHWRDGCVSHRLSVEEGCFRSRAAHSLEALDGILGRFDAVLLSPVFPSVSKPGYGSHGRIIPERVRDRLAARTRDERRTLVYALGGVTAENVSTCERMGFDGVAVMGSVWLAEDPVGAFLRIRRAIPNVRPAASEHSFS